MEKFEFLKKIKPFDLIIIAGIIVALIVGFLTFKHLRQTADKQIETTSPIVFDVYLRGITLTNGKNPIQSGEKTFISIRNVPYSDLDILNVKIERRQVALPMITTIPLRRNSLRARSRIGGISLHTSTIPIRFLRPSTRKGHPRNCCYRWMQSPATRRGMNIWTIRSSENCSKG